MSLAEFFSDHTYRMVFFGTTTIGLVAGALGAFAYLRKQSLISDVIAHAALPGTLGAFLIIAGVFGGDGRTMVGLIVGAVTAGTLAVAAANYVTATTKIRPDAAMALTLTVFFGVGMLLLQVISDGTFPGKGGIHDYLFGNASVITRADLITSVVVGGAALIVMVALFKEFTVATFDPTYARVMGFGGRTVDAWMFSCIVAATVIGVKAVGLVLMVAFVVTPPAAARQWTRTMPGMVCVSGLIGALGSGVGAYLSIVLGNVPTGPLIVLTLFGIFAVSLLVAPRRSIISRLAARAATRRTLLAAITNDPARPTS